MRIRPLTGETGRLTNLSVRAFIASAAEPLIAGFVTAGSGSTRVLVRAIGPGLRAFAVADAVADPQLSVTRNGATEAANDNWDGALAPRFASLGAFPLTSGSLDAALETSVVSGNYTSVVTPAGGGAGTGLIELYETAETPAPRRFVNISARGPVAPARPLIVGFTITGKVPANLLVRGAGPALAGFGVVGALADPALKLYRQDAALWENDNWSGDENDRVAIAAAAASVGAFAFPAGSADAAMVVTLAPGSYTAQISAAGTASTGVALVEVYEVP